MNEEFREILDQAQRLRYPYDYIRVLAYVASRILGGAAEIRILWDLATAYYTSGFYRTPVADIYSPKLAKNPKILMNLGFKQYEITKRNVLWRLNEMAMFIKLSQPSLTYQFIEVEIAGDKVQVISIEDVLAYHLKELINQQSKDSYVKAVMMYIAQKNRISKEKLEKALNRIGIHEAMEVNLNKLNQFFQRSPSRSNDQ